MSSTVCHRTQCLQGTLAGLLLLAAIVGYLIGRTAAVRTAWASPGVQIYSAASSVEPSVQLEGVQNGLVVGSVKGDVRLWIGEEQVQPSADGRFAAHPGPLLINEIEVLVPEGMRYVASRRGSKYYRVSESAGQRIVPENRVYFVSAEEAEAAGYRSGSN